MKQALLIIDVQNDYFSGGKLPLKKPEIALNRINQLEDYFAERKEPIIYIQHIKPNPAADFFGLGTKGAELHSQLKVKEDSIIIEKHFPNSFLETMLLSTLKNFAIHQLIVTGMMTHMCVDSTTRAACELGFQPILLWDATATRDLTFAGETVSADRVQMSFLSALSNFASLKTTADFMKEI